MFGFIGFAYLYKAGSLTPKDMKIGPVSREDMKTDILISVLLVVVASVVKLLLLRYVPSFRFQTDTFLNYEYLTSVVFFFYPLSVVVQELLARIWAQEAMNKVFTGKATGVIITALLFGILHVHKSFVYMILAPLFMLVTDPLYTRQKSIWGVCIVHYMALTAVKGLGYF